MSLKDPKDQALYKMTFALSILGFGLFNYFVGRSYDYNLLAVSWVGFDLVDNLHRPVIPRTFKNLPCTIDKMEN